MDSGTWLSSKQAHINHGVETGQDAKTIRMIARPAGQIQLRPSAPCVAGASAVLLADVKEVILHTLLRSVQGVCQHLTLHGEVLHPAKDSISGRMISSIWTCGGKPHDLAKMSMGYIHASAPLSICSSCNEVRQYIQRPSHAPECHHQILDAVATKHTEQAVLQGQEEAGATWVTLTA